MVPSSIAHRGTSGNGSINLRRGSGEATQRKEHRLGLEAVIGAPKRPWGETRPQLPLGETPGQAAREEYPDQLNFRSAT